MPTNQRFLVLDKGFVEVDRVSDTDRDIVRRARISTAKIAKKFRPDEVLIDYFLQHDHSSPLGFPDIVLLIKAPKFVKEQWFRHRTGWAEDGDSVVVETRDQTASQFHEQQEFSGRYAQYDPSELYLPTRDRLLRQSVGSNQGSGTEPVANPDDILRRMDSEQRLLGGNYEFYLQSGLTRELARANLPFSTYVEFYWKQNLWNLLDWLKKRRNPASQFEIRAYADVIERVVEQHFPLTYGAWVNVVEGAKLTKKELEAIRPLLDGAKLNPKLAAKLGL